MTKAVPPNVAIVIRAFYLLHPDDAEVFREIVRPHVLEVAATEGCAFYDFSTDLNNDARINLSEGWLSEAALKAHLAEPSFHEVLAEVMRRVRIEHRESVVFRVSGQDALDYASIDPAT